MNEAQIMVNMDEVVAELQSERRKNAELLQRVSALEDQIQHEREKSSSASLMKINGQVSHPNSTEDKCSMKHKRQKIETSAENLSMDDYQTMIMLQQDAGLRSPKDSKRVVNWMCMDNDTQSLLFDKSKDVETMLECKDHTDDSDDDEDDSCTYEDAQDNNVKIVDEDSISRAIGEGMCMNSKEIRTRDSLNEIDVLSMSQRLEQDWEEVKKSKGFRNLSLQKKPPKVAFCPKEVRGILESTVLDTKNAQAHTMRKIIVFASLGLRHGCDDMFELNYNHFSILRKGEPYISQSNPGEHVLFENPGVKRKVFYPNRHNQVLCPVRILEEEQAMRPSDATCPSCLFLSIKYGGSTRNIPQNEYVRQRMGRNKLKSFGPLICLMARLVNVRTGSFFFKALGITLLFMAGFPDDIVQRETKYRNLGLLQKYYRTDEDAAGEELYLAKSSASELASPELEKPNTKTTKRLKGKKQQTASSASNENSQRPPQATTTSPLITPTATFQTMPSSNHTIFNSLQPNIFYNQHPVCPMLFPPRPANAMTPLMYWPMIQNAHPTCPHPASTYEYRSLDGIYLSHFMPVHPWPCYSQGLGTHVAADSNEVAITDSASSTEHK